MEIIRLNNVGRKFQKFIVSAEEQKNKGIFRGRVSKNGDFWALRNISLAIGKGEIIGIIGRNGAGKSTLLNIIAGRLLVSEGKVITEAKVSALLTLGAGFQDEFSGKENIYLHASLLGMKKNEIEGVFADIIEFSELGDFINAPLGSYSSGMKMRLGFSVAIHKDFDILVTDEIITVGDVSFQKKCYEKMMDFKRQGKSMVLATQDMFMVERFCDRAFLLENGQLFYAGRPKEVIEQYQMLLSKKKILSDRGLSNMPCETRRWATDMPEWGDREGSKEVTIDSFSLFDSLGELTERLNSQEAITIRVNFTAHKEINDFHFGIAIFREDGVYCYGPNTKFDCLTIESMHKGKGYFELKYNKLLLMPGIYYLSAAIWDKNETFAYDYHKCKYKIEVSGEPAFGQLLNLDSVWNDSNLPMTPKLKYLPNLEHLADKWESTLKNESIKFESLAVLNNYGLKENVFATGRDLKIKLELKIDNSLKKSLESLILWIAIYRSDGVYCHGATKRVASFGVNVEIITYPKLPLLPGEFRVSAGIWDTDINRFLAYSHGIHTFKINSQIKDHGTVYLEHRWNWCLPGKEAVNAK